MYIKLNTTFNPFTYEELVKPLVDYGRAYKEAEDTYSTLAEQAEAFRNEVNQYNSPEAYEIYKKYSNDLDAAMEDFSQGMTGTNRAQLLKLKKDYAKSIIPIAKASAAMKAANEFRDKLGPNAIFEVDRYNSLDPFLRGEVANNKYIDAKQLATMAAARAQTLGPEIYEELLAGGDRPTATAIYNELWNDVNGDSYGSYSQGKIADAINLGINDVAAKIAAGEVMTKAQREANKLSRDSLNFNIKQQEIALKQRGYNKDGSIDPDNPYWAGQNLKYDKEKNTWTSISIPKDKNTSTTMVPTYDTIRYYKSGDKSILIGLPEGEGIKGTKVTVIPKGDKYTLMIGDTELGSITIGKDKVTKSVTPEDGKKVVGETQFDEDYDTDAVMYILDTIQSILENEGAEGLKNYEHYIRFDNEYIQDRGGAYTEPLKRIKVPTTNDDNSVDENLGGGQQ